MHLATRHPVTAMLALHNFKPQDTTQPLNHRSLKMFACLRSCMGARCPLVQAESVRRRYKLLTLPAALHTDQVTSYVVTTSSDRRCLCGGAWLTSQGHVEGGQTRASQLSALCSARAHADSLCQQKQVEVKVSMTRTR
jgi:hypothetical protein